MRLGYTGAVISLLLTKLWFCLIKPSFNEEQSVDHCAITWATMGKRTVSGETVPVVSLLSVELAEASVNISQGLAEQLINSADHQLTSFYWNQEMPREILKSYIFYIRNAYLDQVSFHKRLHHMAVFSYRWGFGSSPRFSQHFSMPNQQKPCEGVLPDLFHLP